MTISISPPQAGVGPTAGKPQSARSDFNPPTPGGVGQGKKYMIESEHEFQSTHPRRGGTAEVTDQRYESLFTSDKKTPEDSHSFAIGLLTTAIRHWHTICSGCEPAWPVMITAASHTSKDEISLDLKSFFCTDMCDLALVIVAQRVEA